jgi:hypothetical protein
MDLRILSWNKVPTEGEEWVFDNNELTISIIPVEGQNLYHLIIESNVCKFKDIEILYINKGQIIEEIGFDPFNQ